MEPSSRATTTSVNVPPMSIPMRYTGSCAIQTDRCSAAAEEAHEGVPESAEAEAQAADRCRLGRRGRLVTELLRDALGEPLRQLRRHVADDAPTVLRDRALHGQLCHDRDACAAFRSGQARLDRRLRASPAPHLA